MDDHVFPVGTKPLEAAEKGLTDHMFAEDWFPIQVKQMDKVGRPDIDAFKAAMEREGTGGRQRGFFVSFGLTKDSEQECAAFHKRTGRIIKLLTVREILDEEHGQKNYSFVGKGAADNAHSATQLPQLGGAALEYTRRNPSEFVNS